MNHNKSLLQIDEVELEDGSHQRLVKIRNPWAQTEWEGPWGDGTEEWEMVPEYEKERIKYENKDDGGFWMSFQGMAIELDFLRRNSWTRLFVLEQPWYRPLVLGIFELKVINSLIKIGSMNLKCLQFACCHD